MSSCSLECPSLIFIFSRILFNNKYFSKTFLPFLSKLITLFFVLLLNHVPVKTVLTVRLSCSYACLPLLNCEFHNCGATCCLVLCLNTYHSPWYRVNLWGDQHRVCWVCTQYGRPRGYAGQVKWTLTSSKVWSPPLHCFSLVKSLQGIPLEWVHKGKICNCWVLSL